MRTWVDFSAPCRLCGEGKDTLSHLAECNVIISMFSALLLSKENPPGPKLIYLGLHKDNTPLAGWNAVLHTLLWKFILIAFTRIDTCGEKPDASAIRRSVLYRSAVRLEAYAHRVQAQQVHAASQHKPRQQQPPARKGPMDFNYGGLLDTSMEGPTKHNRATKWMKAPARPRMAETLKRPKKPVTKWKVKACSAVAPVAKFDEMGRLILARRWHGEYRQHLKMYLDTPCAQHPLLNAQPDRVDNHREYEEVPGTKKQEWMDSEESKYMRIRSECAKIARNVKKELTHPT